MTPRKPVENLALQQPFASSYLGDTQHISGIRENNLKNISLSIGHNQVIALSGVSGSGKSSLAFDTLYAEGARRYIETFSPYTRQFLERLHRPNIDVMTGVRPALALEQHTGATSSRSTVGTITEINDYLKIVWADLSQLKNPETGAIIKKTTVETASSDIVDSIASLQAHLVIVTFTNQISKDSSLNSLSESLIAAGFARYLTPTDRIVERLDGSPAQNTSIVASGEIDVVVDRLLCKNTSSSGKNSLDRRHRQRLSSSLAQAFQAGRGKSTVFYFDEENKLIHEEKYYLGFRCSETGKEFPEPKASMFSFNSPLGACPTCHGFGKTLSIDRSLCIPDTSKSIAEGAIQCWTTKASTWERGALKRFCKKQQIDMTVMWSKLPKATQDLIWNGPDFDDDFYGVMGWFNYLERQRHKMHVRVFLSRYRRETACPECLGARIKSLATCFVLDNLTLPELWQLPVSRALEFIDEQSDFSTAGNSQTQTALKEIRSRLGYLKQIGLGYLTLDRQTKTLSGGESQRVNLTSILGSNLVNSMLVLDEPTIGLHSRDTQKLIQTIKDLACRGNTVVVVEHDKEVIAASDEVIDLGPQAGSSGGEVVYQGTPQGLIDCQRSLTGQYLRSDSRLIRKRKVTNFHNWLTITGAKSHNLKNITVRIPLECFCVVSGVSGSGKSSLVLKCLVEPFLALKRGGNSFEAVASLAGLEHLDEVILIDQSPVGRTPRSNPATYSGAWDIIRSALAQQDKSIKLGLSKSAFSFNVDGGRCPTCKGAGQIRIEMQFLSDVYVECESCGGTRFQDKVREVTIGGKSVVDLLQTPIEDVLGIFERTIDETSFSKLKTCLDPLLSLGLGYLTLGHPINTLSGGEAQRLKLASRLAEEKQGKYLFVLDEPTTGLHPHNISDLLSAFEQLLARGHSIVCIEHNLDVLEKADWIVDLGPDGGDKGGEVIACGTPEDLTEVNGFTSITKQLLTRSKSTTTGKSAKPGRLAKTKAVAMKKRPSTSSQKPHYLQAISIQGARHHNLKNISVQIPQNQVTVVSGVSGSGKSSLAFDILFQEGQRRYIDCLSPYARQFIKQLAKAEVDKVEFLPPTVAISQKTAPPAGLSTIATVSEVYQFLRLLFAKAGVQLCPNDQTPVTSLSPQIITDVILDRYNSKRIAIFAPVIAGRKGHYQDLFRRAARAEISQAIVDGSLLKITDELKLERHKLHWISLKIGELLVNKKNRDLLTEAVEQALVHGNGSLELYLPTQVTNPEVFSVSRMCPQCLRGYRELDPQDFSFRSSRGCCKKCDGRGSISKREGTVICPECQGSRICEVGRNVTYQGRTLAELTQMNAANLANFLESNRPEKRLEPVVEPIMHELLSRLETIDKIGLGYISLDRDATTISGGEAQRLRLAKALGTPLSGVCYVLDEPSIGLHPIDHERLMNTLEQLSELGNTVVVVEHDEAIISRADHVIDFGPGGGRDGGEIVFQGTPDKLLKNKQSLTGIALAKRRDSKKNRINKSSSISRMPKGPKNFIELSGASANNLRDISVQFAVNKLNVVLGVSGAGKSSLVHGCLVPAITSHLTGKRAPKKQYRSWQSITGLESLQRLVEIDQAPVGRTSSSCPASYLGILSDLRGLYASLPEARLKGWQAGHFSFNTGDGRCKTCQGKGFIKVPMSFLPEAVTDCEQCLGLRYEETTLDVTFKGYSIGHLLALTFNEARDILASHPNIARILDYVIELGLGYLSLGQPTHTLSGGEAQRIKLAKELSGSKVKDTLYVLDEPTIGLHMTDVEKLLYILNSLITRGATIVVIEHDLDMIRAADHLIELGPGPAEAGGKLMFSGSITELAKSKKISNTRDFI